MKIFLTGATGYIGSVVAEKLLNKGYEVVGLARNDEAEAKLREQGITPLRGDLKDTESLKRGAREADAVIHTAFIHDFGWISPDSLEKMVDPLPEAVGVAGIGRNECGPATYGRHVNIATP